MTTELTGACQKQYELEQELAFHKIDAKFEPLPFHPNHVSFIKTFAMNVTFFKYFFMAVITYMYVVEAVEIIKSCSINLHFHQNPVKVQSVN